MRLFDVRNVPTVGTRNETAHRHGRTTNGIADGVFGWFPYVQDFTGDFATEWLCELSKPGDFVWDPFLGSGTTVLAAMLLGRGSAGCDMNPFMVDVAKAKTDWSICPDRLQQEAERVSDKYAELSADLPEEPATLISGSWDDYRSVLHSNSEWHNLPDPKLEKWISPLVFERATRLLTSISGCPVSGERRFLRVAVASQLIPISNMSLRPNIGYAEKVTVDAPILEMFCQRVVEMLKDYKVVRSEGLPQPEIVVGDARYDGPDKPDVVFTSPPYPNDMEYIHQTRLELLLLEYVDNAKALTEIKKRMISSSVKLVYKQNEWQKNLGLQNTSVRDVYNQIENTLTGKNWGWNPAAMIAHYFGGMSVVFDNWMSRLSSGGRVGCVIGDSAFNGVKVPTDKILCEMASATGFVVEDMCVFRSRWNNKHSHELRESVIVMRKK